MQPGNCGLCSRAKVGRQLDLTTAFALGMEDGTPRDCCLEHFLEAKCLRAKLDVVVLPLSASANFIFHWE
jgi:hypothetical protein